MKTRKFLPILITGITFVFLFSSCDKKDDNNLSTPISDDEVMMAEDNAMADAIFEETDATVESAASQLDMSGYSVATLKSTTDAPCRVVTVDFPDTTRFPKVITIDYGDGCTYVFNGDTIVKKGQIVITVTGRYFATGSSRIVEFVNFYVNDIKIEGTRTITNLGLNNAGHYEFSIQLEGGKIVVNDTLQFTRESQRKRELILGNIFDTSDDEMYITGEAHGVNFRGEQYVRTIIEPLHLTSCLFIVSGKIESQVGDQAPITLDYGDGTCDNIATLSRNGNTRQITLRFRHRIRGGF